MTLFELKNEDNCDFYIQLKGDHAGKPLAKRIPNSIGVITNKLVLDDKYFWYKALVAFDLGKYLPLIKGSVIPFIMVRDVKKVLTDSLKPQNNER